MQHQHFKLIKIIVVSLFFFSIGIGNIKSQENLENPSPASLTITPTSFDVNVEQNKEYKEKVQVRNNASVSLPVQIEILDYSINEEGVPNYLKDDSLWSSKSWIEIEPNDLIIEANAVRDLDVNISIPEYAEPGSHFAVILFKPVLPADYFETGSTRVIPYIGIVISLNVNAERTSPLKNSVSIIEFSSNTGNGPDLRQFTLGLENTDIFHHKVEGVVTVSNVFNKEVDKITIGDVTLFPKIKRIVKQESSKKFFPGKYTAQLSIKGEQDEIITNTEFWIFPSIQSIILLLLLVTFIYVTIKYRKNLLKAGKVFFTKA